MSDPIVTTLPESKLHKSRFGLSRTSLMIFLPIIAIVLVGLAGHATSSLKPLIIQSFIKSVGFDKATAGFLLTAEMISTSVGSIIATAFPFALRRRFNLFFALGIMLAANLISMPLKEHANFVLYTLRCLSGLGAGFALGRLGILIALSGRPGRTAALYSTSTQIYGAAAAFAMPLLDRLCGANTIFIVLAGTVPLSLLLIKWIPESHQQVEKKKTIDHSQISYLRLWEKVFLAIVFCGFYLGIGTFWPFISVLGETAAISGPHMSAVLGWSAVVSALGSILAIFTGDRKGSASILTIIFLTLSASVLLQLLFPRSLTIFVTSSLLFSFAYWVINPMILAVMSKLDRTGQMNGVYYIVAVAGISIGPAVAGWILNRENDTFVSAEYLRLVSLMAIACASSVQIYYAFRAKRLPD